MSRMSGRMRKKLYAILVQRDGEYCNIGGEPGSSKTLIVDHLDNDSSNNRLSNLHLICRSMNHAKNPRGRSRKQSSESVCHESVDLPRASSAEFLKNLQSEPDFKHFLFIEVWRKGSIEINEAYNCGAAIARCSPETIRRRYLPKEVSRVRPYMVIENEDTKTKYIVFRKHWEHARLKEEKQRTLNRQALNWKDELVRESIRTAANDGNSERADTEETTNRSL